MRTNEPKIIKIEKNENGRGNIITLECKGCRTHFTVAESRATLGRLYCDRECFLNDKGFKI